MKLTKEQFEREGNYRLAVAIMRKLFSKGLLTREEYGRVNRQLVERYRPVWGQLPEMIT